MARCQRHGEWQRTGFIYIKMELHWLPAQVVNHTVSVTLHKSRNECDNAVKYTLEDWKRITASKCALFTNIDTSFVPLGRLLNSGGIIDYYGRLGCAFSDQIRDMLIFDALIFDEDRHFVNLGTPRDNKSGKVASPPPILDNGIIILLCREGRFV